MINKKFVPVRLDYVASQKRAGSLPLLTTDRLHYGGVKTDGRCFLKKAPECQSFIAAQPRRGSKSSENADYSPTVISRGRETRTTA
jgi:hypothetical protein